MKRLALASMIAAAAVAVHAETYIDNARVDRVDPQYETVTIPHQECTSQWVNEAQPAAGPHNYGGALLGGVAGALLGSQVGSGHGKQAATAVGAVVGAFTGDNLANGNAPAAAGTVPREVQSCHTVNEQQTRVSGYRVNYEYRGQHYTTLTHRDPGPSLQVRVTVDPVVR
jgi:uncharacterized protein YcfJ